MIYGIAKTFFISFTIAALINHILTLIKSEFLFNFLSSNIINIQIALLAVNAATLGIVLTKIRDIIERTGAVRAFEMTRKEMLLSIKEQIALIVFSLTVLAIKSATNLPLDIPLFLIQTALIASFIYSINILYDTAKSVFVILDF